jgi:hypothetical protein
MNEDSLAGSADPGVSGGGISSPFVVGAPEK